MTIRSDFTVVSVQDTAIFIRDEDGYLSVTNDAEAVVDWILTAYSDDKTRRIIYRDTIGQWDELIHDGEKFVGFGPYSGPTP